MINIVFSSLNSISINWLTVNLCREKNNMNIILCDNIENLLINKKILSNIRKNTIYIKRKYLIKVIGIILAKYMNYFNNITVYTNVGFKIYSSKKTKYSKLEGFTHVKIVPEIDLGVKFDELYSIEYLLARRLEVGINENISIYENGTSNKILENKYEFKKSNDALVIFVDSNQLESINPLLEEGYQIFSQEKNDYYIIDILIQADKVYLSEACTSRFPIELYKKLGIKIEN